jgi:hypothetical protein
MEQCAQLPGLEGAPPAPPPQKKNARCDAGGPPHRGRSCTYTNIEMAPQTQKSELTPQ